MNDELNGRMREQLKNAKRQIKLLKQKIAKTETECLTFTTRIKWRDQENRKLTLALTKAEVALKTLEKIVEKLCSGKDLEKFHIRVEVR